MLAVFRKYLILFLLVSLGSTLLAQRRTFFSQSELGVLFGGSYYVGDINPVKHFRDSKIAFGLMYRYNINQRVDFRVTALKGEFIANDSKSEIPFNVNRNLNFQSDIYELTAGMEINLFKFRTNDFRYGITPYFFYALGLLYHNPKAEYGGQLISLQELGTEGQGTALSDEKPYSKLQLSVPLGLGFKFLIAKRVILSFEYGFRFTFTDYLDDVSGTYVDPDKLAALNGPIAADMSDQTLQPVGANGSNVGLNRGKSETNDFYGIFSTMLTFQLGKEDPCFFKARF